MTKSQNPLNGYGFINNDDYMIKKEKKCCPFNLTDLSTSANFINERRVLHAIYTYPAGRVPGCVPPAYGGTPGAPDLVIAPPIQSKNQSSIYPVIVSITHPLLGAHHQRVYAVELDRGSKAMPSQCSHLIHSHHFLLQQHWCGADTALPQSYVTCSYFFSN